LLHQAHILLFTIAIMHITYAGVSMTMTLWKVSRWRRYENDAVTRGVQKIHVRCVFADTGGTNPP
jgi:hypothetical protein